MSTMLLGEGLMTERIFKVGRIFFQHLMSIRIETIAQNVWLTSYFIKDDQLVTQLVSW